jgi:hypothetical protein
VSCSAGRKQLIVLENKHIRIFGSEVNGINVGGKKS